MALKLPLPILGQKNLQSIAQKPALKVTPAAAAHKVSMPVEETGDTDLKNMLTVADHARIIKDLEGVCQRAGIPEKYLRHSAKTYCSHKEIEWLAGFYETGHPGLILTGSRGLERCMSLAGALLRNYVDARVVTLEHCVEVREQPHATCLLIPNFCTTQSSKTTPGWKMTKLYDLMLSRFQSDTPTVVWIESLACVKDYGTAMSDLLSSFKKS